MKKDTLLKLAKEFCETCPNCGRKMPNKDWRRKHGCKYCIPKKSTQYGNGKY